MKSILIAALLFGLTILSAKSCYSIEAEAGRYTPISPLYLRKDFDFNKSCTLFDMPILYKDNRVYIGCYKSEEEASSALKTLRPKVENPRIVRHTPREGDPYLLIPRPSTIKFRDVKERLSKVYEAYRPEKLLRQFPEKSTSGRVELIASRDIGFLPLRNLYELSRWSEGGMDRKFLVISQGNYDLELLRKEVNDPKLIRKVDERIYEIRVPIVVGPMASLTIRDKTVRLEAVPNPIVIFYFGKLYLGGSDFLTWDFKEGAYCPREPLAEKELLYLGVERPRPYIMGLAGSHTLMVNNRFKGLGYHGTIGPFGISLVHYPSDTPFVGPSFMMNYLVGSLPRPDGALVGNDIEDGSMGFYTNDAGKTVLLGNYFHDNVIYNMDPHDYSEELIIARNLSVRARHAHGIVISRHVERTIIAENLMMNNHAGGVMFDRNSNNNAVYRNMAVNNGFMGISIQESRNALIAENYVSGNHMDGVILRNSLQMSVVKNRIEGNGKNGIEILIKNIDDTQTREFPRDPYVKAAAGVIEENNISGNLMADIKVKNSAAVSLKANRVGNQGTPYGGDLNTFLPEIAESNGSWTLYGRGFPFLKVSTDLAEMDPEVYRLARQIFIDIYQAPNQEAALTLSAMYLDKEKRDLAKMEMGRAGSNVEKKILAYLGYWLLIESRERGWKEKRLTHEGLTFLLESAILDNRFVARDIPQLHHLVPVKKDDFAEAFTLAKRRMKEGRLFSAEDYRHSVLCRNTFFKKSRTKAALQRFLYRMKEVGEKDIVRFCRKETASSPYLTAVIIGAAKTKYKENNTIKDMPALQREERDRRAQKTRVCRHYLEKQTFLQKEADALMETLKKGRIEKWKPYLRQYLDMINEFRIRKLSMKDLIDILESPIASYEAEREAKGGGITAQKN